MTTQSDMRARCAPNAPIQWHLKTSKHDTCPECGGEVGYLSQFERMCVGECASEGLGWSVPQSDRRHVVADLEARASMKHRDWTGALSIPEGRAGEWAVEHVVRPAGATMPIDNARTAIMTGRRQSTVTFENETRWHRLTQGGSIWMTDYPIEQIQHDRELAPMSGRVLVGGLGLGYAATKLCSMEQVEEVVVVEKASEVAFLVAPHVEHPKLTVVVEDLFEYLKGYHGLPFDWGFYDIWQSDGEGTFHHVVVPLRELSEGKVENVVCWNEDVMRGQLAMGLRSRAMAINGDYTMPPGTAKPTPETFMEREDIYSAWAIPFWQAVRAGRIPYDEAVGASQFYATIYGTAGWRDQWDRALEATEVTR